MDASAPRLARDICALVVLLEASGEAIPPKALPPGVVGDPMESTGDKDPGTDTEGERLLVKHSQTRTP